MTRFGRSTVGSELFVTHDVAREEAFIDAFASLRATATLDAHDEHFDTYLAIQDELLPKRVIAGRAARRRTPRLMINRSQFGLEKAKSSRFDFTRPCRRP